MAPTYRYFPMIAKDLGVKHGLIRLTVSAKETNQDRGGARC